MLHSERAEVVYDLKYKPKKRLGEGTYNQAFLILNSSLVPGFDGKWVEKHQKQKAPLVERGRLLRVWREVQPSDIPIFLTVDGFMIPYFSGPPASDTERVELVISLYRSYRRHFIDAAEIGNVLHHKGIPRIADHDLLLRRGSIASDEYIEGQLQQANLWAYFDEVSLRSNNKKTVQVNKAIHYLEGQIKPEEIQDAHINLRLLEVIFLHYAVNAKITRDTLDTLVEVFAADSENIIPYQFLRPDLVLQLSTARKRKALDFSAILEEIKLELLNPIQDMRDNYYSEKLALLVRHKVSLDDRGEYGYTLAQVAVFNKDRASLKLLMDASADLSILSDPTADYPLMTVRDIGEGFICSIDADFFKEADLAYGNYLDFVLKQFYKERFDGNMELTISVQGLIQGLLDLANDLDLLRGESKKLLNLIHNHRRITVWQLNKKGSLLHNAVAKGNLKLIAFLSRLPDWSTLSQVRNPTNNGTLLHQAASCSVPEIFDFLKAIPVDEADFNGNRALHMAVAQKNMALANYLVKQAANIDVQNKSGNAPIHTAAKSGLYDFVLWLSKLGARHSMNHAANTPAQFWPEDKRPNPFLYFFDALYKFTEGKSVYGFPSHFDFVAFIIKHPHMLTLEVGDPVLPLLFHVLINLPEAIIQDLAALECWPHLIKIKSSSLESLYHHIASKGLVRLFSYLNTLDIDAIDETGQTPLHYAAKAKQREAAEYLLDKGAEIDKRDDSGYTPLILASKSYDFGTCYLLLERGANPLLENNNRTAEDRWIDGNNPFVAFRKEQARVAAQDVGKALVDANRAGLTLYTKPAVQELTAPEPHLQDRNRPVEGGLGIGN